MKIFFYKRKTSLFKLLFFIAISSGFSLYAQVKNSKVVLISVDGVPDYLVDKYLDNGVLPADGAFAKMKSNGAFASTLLPINVASTGPSHISIFTGASPSKTGIVGNGFRKKNQKWDSQNLSAFNQPLTAETIFQAAKRQGKKVIAINAVGVDNIDDSRMSDLMHMYPKIIGPSLIIDLEVTDSIIYENDIDMYTKLKTSVSSPSKPVFEIFKEFKKSLYFYLKEDMINTSKELEIIVDDDTDLKNGYLTTIISNELIKFEIEKENKIYNSSFRILKADLKNNKFQLFMTAPVEVFSQPRTFFSKIQHNCGSWPGEPENRKQTSGLVSEQTWFDQLETLSKYSKDLILTGMQEPNWDLLFGYFSTLDDVQHRYTLTNPRQVDYNADNGKRPEIYAKHIEKQFQKVDTYLLEIMNAMPKDANLIVFSDHGMIPIHTVLMLNNFFQEEGFNENIISVTSGNSAHIYINKEKIKSDNYDEYIDKIKNALKNLKDKKTGEQIFELVANYEQQKKYGLYNSDYSGDLFVSCKAGYTISDRFLPGVNSQVQNSFDPKMFEKENEATRKFLLSGTMNETGRAVHGNLSSIREGQSIFYAIGPNVPRKEIKEMQSIQIAATVAKLLEIEAPKDAEKKSVF